MKNWLIVLRVGLVSIFLIITCQGNSSGKIDDFKKNPVSRILTNNKNLRDSPPFSSAIERLLNYIEKNIVSTSEAMPEDKFYFSPQSLDIKGSAFRDVRSFAAQVKHLTADNFAIWSPITGEPLRSDIQDVNGPENIKTKAEIIKFLKESFALGHKAIASITEKNAMDMLPFRGGKLPRLDLAFYALTHANEHYGQMVVYLRMCGIIPPASMPVKN
jgi:uncharacterized damage-inducible protein DinB